MPLPLPLDDDKSDIKHVDVPTIEVDSDTTDPLAFDDAVLQAQGRKAELDRSFSWLGALGLSYTISNCWLGYAATIGTMLVYGGGQIAISAAIISAITQWIVFVGLAELCSAFPSSGGQYHFTYIVAPQSTRNFAAYMVGITNTIAWWVTTASGTIYTAISAFGIAQFWTPGFTNQHWQVYLCYVLVIGLTLIPIFTIPQRRIDWLTQSTLYLSLLGLALVLTIVPAMSRTRYHGSALTQSQGSSGWSTGTAWMLSICTGQYMYAGIGAVTHIAEEMPRPGRKIPLVLNTTMLIGLVTVIPWTVVMVGGIQDLDAVQKAFVPSLEIFYQATGSRAAATFLQSYLTFLYASSIPSQWITCSRIAWAFSRDNGLPFSPYWSRIHPTYHIPVRTTLLSASFCLLYGLVYIASTAAFNSIVNISTLLLNVTYIVPQGILATGNRARMLPARPFSLGAAGYAVNWFSVLWLVASGVLMCFPTTLPTSLGSMNYESVVLVGIFLAILVLWVERRGKFSGPAIDWEALNARNKME